MTTALQIVQIIFHSVAIIFMLCFIFIGIWSFIVFLKMAKNQRIQTYLLEKINKSICSIENNKKKNNQNLDSDFLMENLITDDTDEDDNIIKFDDNII